jgi:hypothetical protein
MNLFGNLALGFAAFVYLIPLQITLRQPTPPGHAGLGTAFALVAFMGLLWVSLLSAWCVLVAQGGLAWIGGGRPLQFLAMFSGWLALVAVTTLSVFLRGDTQLPLALRPFMPWAIYVVPALLLGATALLLNPEMIVRPQLFTAGRFALGFCGALALASAMGIAAEYAVQRQRQITRQQHLDPANREKHIRRLVREVDSLDPQRDFAQLLLHVGPDRFSEPEQLAARKILSHPHLNDALGEILVSAEPSEALKYLGNYSPPNVEALAGPVRHAILNTASRIRREIRKNAPLTYKSFFNETDLVLRAANRFVDVRGADHLTAVHELRGVFDCPQVKATYVDAVRLLDDWLRNEAIREPHDSGKKQAGNQTLHDAQPSSSAVTSTEYPYAAPTSSSYDYSR